MAKSGNGATLNLKHSLRESVHSAWKRLDICSLRSPNLGLCFKMYFTTILLITVIIFKTIENYHANKHACC